jgi:hypothetical protein
LPAVSWTSSCPHWQFQHGGDGNDGNASSDASAAELLQKLDSLTDPQASVIGQILKPVLATQLASNERSTQVESRLSEMLSIVQMQADLVRQLQERVESPAASTEQGAYKFKTPAFARHGVLAHETLIVGRALQDTLRAVSEGASLTAAQCKPLLANLSALLQKHQESYEFYVIADMDGLKVAQQLSSTADLSGFSEEFKQKRKAACEAAKEEEKAAAKKVKEEKPKEEKKSPANPCTYGSFGH